MLLFWFGKGREGRRGAWAERKGFTEYVSECGKVEYRKTECP